MATAPSVKALAAIIRAVPSAVVTVSGKVDANTAFTASGMRGRLALTRGQTDAGMIVTKGCRVTCYAADLPDVALLDGKLATITGGAVDQELRILGAELSQDGGVVRLDLYEPERAA